MVVSFEDFCLITDLDGCNILSFYDSISSFKKSNPDLYLYVLHTEEVVVMWHTNTRKHIILEIAPNGCWECISHGLDRDGYPKIDVCNRTRRMSRFSYCVFNDGCWLYLPKLLRHTCDNRLCVCPDHLKPGDPASNSWDMVQRERSLSGIKNSQSKLSEEDVAYIRNSAMDNKYLAGVLNVHVETIRRVRKNKTYK